MFFVQTLSEIYIVVEVKRIENVEILGFTRKWVKCLCVLTHTATNRPHMGTTSSRKCAV